MLVENDVKTEDAAFARILAGTLAPAAHPFKRLNHAIQYDRALFQPGQIYMQTWFHESMNQQIEDNFGETLHDSKWQDFLSRMEISFQCEKISPLAGRTPATRIMKQHKHWRIQESAPTTWWPWFMSRNSVTKVASQHTRPHPTRWTTETSWSNLLYAKCTWQRHTDTTHTHVYLYVYSWCSLFHLEMNGSDVVAEGCTHFSQLLVWERKEKPEVGTGIGKRVKKSPTQIWPYLCRTLFNSFPNLISVLDRRWESNPRRGTKEPSYDGNLIPSIIMWVWCLNITRAYITSHSRGDFASRDLLYPLSTFLSTSGLHTCGGAPESGWPRFGLRT